MSRGRRRKKSARGRWLWVVGAAVGALVAYFFVAHRHRGSSVIPLPGEATLQPAPPAAAQGPEKGTAQGPAEVIHDSERQKLDRVLRERAR